MPTSSSQPSHAPSDAPSLSPTISQVPSAAPSRSFGFFLISADANTTCFVSDDRQCIYSDSDGAGSSPYPDGDCTFGINIPLDIIASGLVNVSAVGDYEVADDVFRMDSTAEMFGTPDWPDTSMGPLNILVNSNTEFNWRQVGGDNITDSGWTICIQEIEEVMFVADSATVLTAGEAANQLIERTIDQSGLDSNFAELDNYTDVAGIMHDSTLSDDNLVWTAATGDNATIIYNLTEPERISGIVWWPNDGETVNQVDVRFSDDPGCDSSTFDTAPIFFVGGMGGKDFFVPTDTNVNDVVAGELIRFNDQGRKFVCVEFTLNCDNPCSIGEVAFIGPDPNVPPVEPP